MSYHFTPQAFFAHRGKADWERGETTTSKPWLQHRLKILQRVCVKAKRDSFRKQTIGAKDKAVPSGRVGVPEVVFFSSKTFEAICSFLQIEGCMGHTNPHYTCTATTVFITFSLTTFRGYCYHQVKRQKKEERKKTPTIKRPKCKVEVEKFSAECDSMDFSQGHTLSAYVSCQCDF